MGIEEKYYGPERLRTLRRCLNEVRRSGSNIRNAGMVDAREKASEAVLSIWKALDEIEDILIEVVNDG